MQDDCRRHCLWIDRRNHGIGHCGKNRKIRARPGRRALWGDAHAVYDAIASTLPKGAARWPMQPDRDQCFIQSRGGVVDRMRAMRRPGESYSKVILRLVKLETSDLNKPCNYPGCAVL